MKKNIDLIRTLVPFVMILVGILILIIESVNGRNTLLPLIPFGIGTIVSYSNLKKLEVNISFRGWFGFKYLYDYMKGQR